MSWRVFVRAAAEVDLEALVHDDRLAVSDELFRRVADGPPQET